MGTLSKSRDSPYVSTHGDPYSRAQSPLRRLTKTLVPMGLSSCHRRSVGASPAAPLGGIRQHEQVQTGEQEQREREHRQEAHLGCVLPLYQGDDDKAPEPVSTGATIPRGRELRVPESKEPFAFIREIRSRLCLNPCDMCKSVVDLLPFAFLPLCSPTLGGGCSMPGHDIGALRTLVTLVSSAC